jgi:hypothetical protein
MPATIGREQYKIWQLNELYLPSAIQNSKEEIFNVLMDIAQVPRRPTDQGKDVVFNAENAKVEIV